MAWEHFPVQRGQRITTAMLNELLYAAHERGLYQSNLLEDPQSGWSASRTAAWLSALRTCVSGTSTQGNGFCDLTWSSSSEATAPLFFAGNFLSKIFGQPAWPTEIMRGARIMTDSLNDLYTALNALAYRCAGFAGDYSGGSGFFQACTNGAPSYAHSTESPYHPTYANYYLCYGSGAGYTPTQAGQLSCADADAMLGITAYASQQNQIGSFANMVSNLLWQACEAWLGDFEGTYMVSWNAIRGWAVRACQLRYFKTDDYFPEWAPQPTVVASYVPMSFFCRINSISGFPTTKIGALTRSIGVDVRYSSAAPTSADRGWGTLHETVSVTGQLDDLANNCIPRIFKFDGLPEYVGVVPNSSADGTTSIRGNWNSGYTGYANVLARMSGFREYAKEEVSIMGWVGTDAMSCPWPVVECEFTKSDA